MRYDPLESHLRAQAGQRLNMTFAEIERVIGRSLPVSARRHRPWWANASRPRNPLAKAWAAAGFRTADVDLASETLAFKRVPQGVDDEERISGEDVLLRFPGLRGLYNPETGPWGYAPGVDPTAPVYTDDEWAEIEADKEQRWRELQDTPFS